VNATALKVEMSPAFSASPILPVVTPVTKAAARPAHTGARGVAQSAAAAISKILPTIGTRCRRFWNPPKISFQKHPMKQ
jgi:hypothetical protein